VVCGHPERHVVRVELAGNVFYLKRQHRVGWRERFKQWRAGFGWSSRSEREARMLRELDAAGFPSPKWVAYGEDSSGRAFLMLEELTGCVELRRILSDNALSQPERRDLIERLGRDIAELHAAGFDTPDLTAPLPMTVNGRLDKSGDVDSFAVTLIDWQNARRTKRPDSIRSLAALHSSLADELASPRERLRFLNSYCLVSKRCERTDIRFSSRARMIEREAARIGNRRSIRDQRQLAVAMPDQRLVWLAGEAVCAVPDVAAMWPIPAIAPPFYGCESGCETIQLPDGRDAILLRGRSFSPLNRFRSWLRGRSWRSPGANLGRVLFHLDRYGIAAPRLFAFGQRMTGAAIAEWFVLHERFAGVEVSETRNTPAIVALLAQLHDAGCRPDFGSGMPLRLDGDRAIVGDPRGIRIVRRVSERQRRSDLKFLLKRLHATR